MISLIMTSSGIILQHVLAIYLAQVHPVHSRVTVCPGMGNELCCWGWECLSVCMLYSFPTSRGALTCRGRFRDLRCILRRKIRRSHLRRSFCVYSPLHPYLLSLQSKREHLLTHPLTSSLTRSLTHSLFHCLSVQVQREHHLPPGAFPDVNRFTDILSAFISHPACCCHLVFRNTIVQYRGSAHSVTRSPSHPPTHSHTHSLTHRLCTSSRSTQSITHSLTHCLSVQVQREHHLPPGDFPDVNRFRDILSAFDFAAFPKMSKSMVKQIDDVLSVDIPNLVRAFDNPYS